MSKSISIFSAFASKYSKSLIESPYKTKMITNGVIFGLADLICQSFVEKKSADRKLNYGRLLNMMAVGGLCAAPLGHLWYNRWAPALVSKITSNAKIQPILAMAADQLIYTPPMIYSFLFIAEYMKNFSFKQGIRNANSKILKGLETNWKVWPPVQLLNFTIVPSQFRVPFVSFVGLFWTIYLSYLQNSN